MTAGRIQSARDQIELGCVQLGEGEVKWEREKPGSAAKEVRGTKGVGTQNS